MLDKTLPYYNFIMRYDNALLQTCTAPVLPGGFSFLPFGPADEAHWADIVTSVGEFPAREKAAAYFAQTYLPHSHMLPQRCFFVVDAAGRHAATATAWYRTNENGFGYRAAVNWVAARPEYQNRGLGKAAVRQVLYAFKTLEPTRDIYLHTQTWSHKAIGMYLSLGFYPLKYEHLPGYGNDYEKVVETLRGVLPEEYHRLLVETAR